MKKAIIIIFSVILVGGIILSVIFFPYIHSFIKYDTELLVKRGDFTENTVQINGKTVEYTVNSDKATWQENGLFLSGEGRLSFADTDNGIFNYYGISYSADCYVKGILTYETHTGKEISEEFFLERAKKGEFYSFIDGLFDKVKGKALKGLTLIPLDTESGEVTIHGISLFNREIPDREVYLTTDTLKIGVDMLWGGALSYLEDLDSNVQAVYVDDRIRVDSNAAEKFGTKSVNDNVNLINRNDTGRLVQQSYYGTDQYDCGTYMDNKWNYNPVQGGNQFNDAAKIVDLRVTDDSIYIKCRPLDWAKEKEYITPSYMEATYSIEKNTVHTSCRFVDFSGYPPMLREQEIPAFYCIEPLNNFVYYAGEKPWTGDSLTSEPDLIFWPDAGYPKFHSRENWAAFTGEDSDSFGIGICVPGKTEFLSGVYNRETTTNEDPSKDGATSYIAVIDVMEFKSFSPFEYDFYLATGTTDEIRTSFSAVADSK